MTYTFGYIMVFALIVGIISSVYYASVGSSNINSHLAPNAAGQYNHRFQVDTNAALSLWGSYMPDKYFGLKSSHTQRSYISGLFWKSNDNQVRHSVKMDEVDMKWRYHNGINYGVETMRDKANGLELLGKFSVSNNSNSAIHPTWIQEVNIHNEVNSDNKELFVYNYFTVQMNDAIKVGNSHASIAKDEYYIHDISLWKHSNAFNVSTNIDTYCTVEESSGSQCVVNSINSLVYAIGYSVDNGWFIIIYQSSDASDSSLSYGCPSNIDDARVETSIDILDKAHDQRSEYLKHKADIHAGKRVKNKELSDSWKQYLHQDGKLKHTRENGVCTNTFYVQYQPKLDGSSEKPSLTIAYYDHLPVKDVVEAQRYLVRDILPLHTLITSPTAGSVAIEVGSVDSKDVLESGQALSLTPIQQLLLQQSNDHEEAFHLQFAASFIQSSSPSQTHVEAGKQILSDVLGGIGYYYGVPEILPSKESSASNGNLMEYVSVDLAGEPKREVRADGERKPLIAPIALLCSTPSRTSFPRGFLWDEGFHQLVISKYNPILTLTIVDHWVSAQYHTEGSGNGGYIPREMILGDESRAKVPAEFIPQHADIANPPTLLLAIDSVIQRYLLLSAPAARPPTDIRILYTQLFQLYPKVHSWIQWFITSQSSEHRSKDGSTTTTYHWKGRINVNLDHKRLLVNTLASGLDDYPRAEIPHPLEEHVDLLSWMIKSCTIMHQWSTLLVHVLQATPKDYAAYASSIEAYTQDQMYYKALLVKLRKKLEGHWSSSLQAYVDKGLHDAEGSKGKSYFVNKVVIRCGGDAKGSSAVDSAAKIEKKGGQYALNTKNACPGSHPVYLFPLGDGAGGYLMREEIQVTSKFNRTLNKHIPLIYSTQESVDAVVTMIPRLGYVSLFPFALRIMSIDILNDGVSTSMDTQLTALLGHIRNSSELWTEYGIRSLSATDLFYNRPNAPGDAPYWRGPIWMNMNYLILNALYYYGHRLPTGNINQPVCMRIYQELRANLIHNVIDKEYKTGYLWEHYDDATGKGTRGHPFTGWTSLIVNIMYELFDV